MQMRNKLLIQKTVVCFVLCTAFYWSTGSVSQTAEKQSYWIIKPFWNTSSMEDESLFFIQENPGDQPSASLLFTPDTIITVRSANQKTHYQRGRDYIYTPGCGVVTLPEGSRIPYKKKEDMYPPVGAPQSIAGYHRDNANLFFGEGHVFHDLQAVVTYSHSDFWKGYRPFFAGRNLPTTLHKLTRREIINLIVFGDSISEGYNASAFTKTIPYMPPYGELVAHNLEAHYGVEVQFTNFSRAGKTTTWAVENISQIVNAEPDLLIIAFGMNDASRKFTPQEFSANVQTIISSVRQQQPRAEFILVATMTGNPDWNRSSPALYPQYRDALVQLCGKGIVLADMTAVWTEVLKHKKFADITGNGVNHPNDFGHRLYAAIILGLLIDYSM